MEASSLDQSERTRTLHLHLGAHKTATSHLQRVLFANSHRFPAEICYEPHDTVRESLRWNGCNDLLENSVAYLERLASNGSTTQILSEENIVGETKEIFQHSAMYPHASKRLNSMSKFFDHYDHLEIWFGVRSLDEFLPSIYIECLRHFDYQDFSKVYAGRFEQSWASVISQIKGALPRARINIIQHKYYRNNLPKIVEQMTSMRNQSIDLLREQIIRPSPCASTIEVYRRTNGAIPKRLQSLTIDTINRVFFFSRTRFRPLTEKEEIDLKANYQEDIEAISKLDNVFLF